MIHSEPDQPPRDTLEKGFASAFWLFPVSVVL